MVKKLAFKFMCKTPMFWKIIQRILVCIGSLSIILIANPDQFDFLPPIVAKVISICSLIGAFITQFTTNEKDDNPPS